MANEKELIDAARKAKWGNYLDKPKVWLIDKFTGQRVLDIGCGPNANYSNYLLERGKTVTVIDSMPKFLDKIKNKKIKKILGKAEDLHFKDNTFDTVLLFDILEHIKDDKKALLEAYRVCKKNILITVPNDDKILNKSGLIYRPWLDRTHIRAYDGLAIKELMKKCGIKKFKIYKTTKIGLFSLFVCFFEKKQVKARNIYFYFLCICKKIFEMADKITKKVSPFYMTSMIVVFK